MKGILFSFNFINEFSFPLFNFTIQDDYDDHIRTCEWSWLNQLLTFHIIWFDFFIKFFSEFQVICLQAEES